MSAVSASVRLGLASAGVGAGLLGFALLGPEIGSAAADSGETSVSASAGDSAGPSAKAERRERIAERRNAAQRARGERAARRAEVQQERADRVADKIDDWASDAQARIDSRPLSDAKKDRLEQRLTNVRHTFFNQAPTVAPVQVSGVVEGPITGTVGASDADGDAIKYRVAKRPRTGVVTLNPDGTYAYTPGKRFNGVDSFVVNVRDVGPNVNLFSWLGGVTRAQVLINHGAVTFEFHYKVGAEHWTPDRQAALERVADNITEYLRVYAPVTLVYRVDGAEDPEATWLAAASSGLTSDDPGFWPTIVQNKLITGVDANGSKADGYIEWNFGFPTAIGDVVTGDDYDFTSIVMHELMHSFGFNGAVGAPGSNGDRRSWSTWDQLLVDADGTTLISADFTWRETSDGYLLGADGGVKFGGAHAVDAYGKPVPVYSPSTWSSGSSVYHLDTDTFTGDNFQLMNHRIKAKGDLGVRELSAIEIGILRDLGYTVVPPTHSMAALGFVVLLWRRRAKKA
ncbi:Ig-like domain-containing protein [Mycobacterium sp. PSTR-4-N]|uniref:Ig-like domain-containing protein n=1 Tax=Mycobacterium sp. PSTR-4-N TaxID=2917745 RepID=UPI001F152C45|nr:Ig-like domain-containing protein [Mycobacterium sp. PSTR-4-N]MCG7592814.1 Ig-like domain-containing protein [Mycobacterium sp. PSTR-4-N]